MEMECKRATTNLKRGNFAPFDPKMNIAAPLLLYYEVALLMVRCFPNPCRLSDKPCRIRMRVGCDEHVRGVDIGAEKKTECISQWCTYFVSRYSLTTARLDCSRKLTDSSTVLHSIKTIIRRETH